MKHIGIILLVLLTACGKETPASVKTKIIKQDEPRLLKNIRTKENKNATAGLVEEKGGFSAFLPKGYVIFEKNCGDLNKDGLEDCILVIKAQDKSRVVKNDHGKLVDRNRRGIIVLFKTKDGYELAAKNYDCFSSENEDGGVYYAPELSVEIRKGKLFVDYSHGRYGNWRHTFRHQNRSFELIGFDSDEHSGPILDRSVSINFLTKKKLIKTNTNQNTKQSGDEIFHEKWEDINVGKLLKLSEIKDFDSVDVLKK